MSYYQICPYCGSHLDPGEKCDCQKKESAAQSEANTLSGKDSKTVFILHNVKGRCQA